MRVRVVIGLGFAALGAVACGLSIVGAGDDDASDTSPEGGAANGGGDSAIAPPPPPIDPFEGGIDASPDNCNAGCDGGTCDGGWCVIACDGGAECQNGVTCPPGIPCDVRCAGDDACKGGVDCANATACNVVCAGKASCNDRKVTCKGEACQVTCSEKDSCIDGIVCDAGTCVLRCLADDTCKNNPVLCDTDRCTVECGVEGKKGKDACIGGVRCRAKTSCDVRCLAENTCKNDSVVAVAGDTVNVTCAGLNSCVARVFASAGDSGVQCLEEGTCTQGVSCDGGRCAAHCEKSDSHLCCDASTCVPTEDECRMEEKCP